MKASVVTKVTDNTHARMELRAGAKGTGRLLHVVNYWTDHQASYDAAYDLCRNEAERLGATLTQHDLNDERGGEQ